MMPAARARVKEVASRNAIEGEPPDWLLVVVQPPELPDPGEKVRFGVLEGRGMLAVRVGSSNEGRASHCLSRQGRASEEGGGRANTEGGEGMPIWLAHFTHEGDSWPAQPIEDEGH